MANVSKKKSSPISFYLPVRTCGPFSSRRWKRNVSRRWSWTGRKLVCDEHKRDEAICILIYPISAFNYILTLPITFERNSIVAS